MGSSSFFQHLEYVIPLSLAAFIISDEKSAVSLTGIPLYIKEHLSLTAFKIFFFSLVSAFLPYVRCGSLYLFYLEFVECLGCVNSCFSSYLRNFQASFLQIMGGKGTCSLVLSLSPLLSGIMLGCLMVSHISLRPCSFPLFFRLYNLYQDILTFMSLSSSSLNIVLSLLLGNFIFVFRAFQI